MSSKRHQRYRSCTSKLVYRSEDHAQNVSQRVSQERGYRVIAYPCHFGQHWHLCKPRRKG